MGTLRYSVQRIVAHLALPWRCMTWKAVCVCGFFLLSRPFEHRNVKVFVSGPTTRGTKRGSFFSDAVNVFRFSLCVEESRSPSPPCASNETV